YTQSSCQKKYQNVGIIQTVNTTHLYVIILYVTLCHFALQIFGTVSLGCLLLIVSPGGYLFIKP
ncbi:hypothetical protein P7M41_26565, partial [Vibrio parahaemolyticus]|nr:hypothetical protein [Vibrio parahaemolyticus]